MLRNLTLLYNLHSFAPGQIKHESNKMIFLFVFWQLLSRHFRYNFWPFLSNFWANFWKSEIVYDQLYEYFTVNNLLTHCQSGFRSLHSILTALVGATNSPSVNINNSLVNGVIFIDLKTAFDTIDHSLLIRKLLRYGVDTSSLKRFESYLCHRSQKCSINGRLSAVAPVYCSVPQGSNLGPLLMLV